MSSSVTLPVVDLAGAVVGTSNSVPWETGTNQSSNRRAHLSLYNESGCALQITLADGASFYLPAGGWQMIELEPSTRSLQYTVLHVMPNAQVTKLFLTWYPPDASSFAAPRVPILGNSPIGGSVTNTAANLLQGTSGTSAVTEINAGLPDGGPVLIPATVGKNIGLGAVDTINGTQVGLAVRTDGRLWVINQVAVYNNTTLAGQGLPLIVAAVKNFQVTTTGLKTVLTFTGPVSDGLFRINWSVKVSNAISGNNITAQVAFTDGGSAQTKFLNAAGGGGAANTLGFIGSNSILNSWYPGLPAMILAQANTAITISYNDPTNTPNDFVSAVIEQLL